MTLKELLKALADKKAAGQAKLNEFNTLGAKADRSDEDEARLTALESELEALETEVADLQAQSDREEKAKRRGALFATAAQPRVFGAAARTVNEPNPETTGGFKSISDFASAVVQTTLGHHDARFAAAASTYNSNGGSAGEGFLVPPDYSSQIWDIAFEGTDLLGMANPEPTQSNAVFKPKDETTPWGAVGVQAAWRSEASQMQASKVQVSGELMTLHELYAFVAASSEVLSDAPMLQNRLTRQAGAAIGWTASEAVMWGNGVGKPTGFMASPGLVTVTKDTSQPAATLSVNNLLRMAASVLRYGGKPIWIANPDVLPQLGQLTIGNVPAYLPNNRPLEGDPFEGMLLGYPVLFSEHAQTLGTSGDIVCANMAGYYAATKAGAGAGIEFASSMHLYFDQNLTAFRWTFRLTGQPFLSKPVQPAKGSTTKSHFVALQSR